MTTLVVNIRLDSYDVYIGRPGRWIAAKDAPFGNPRRFAGSLDEAILAYRSYFEQRIATDPEFKRRVLALRGKRLGCFCKPLFCHGDVIAEWVDAQPEASTNA